MAAASPAVVSHDSASHISSVTGEQSSSHESSSWAEALDIVSCAATLGHAECAKVDAAVRILLEKVHEQLAVARSGESIAVLLRLLRFRTLPARTTASMLQLLLKLLTIDPALSMSDERVTAQAVPACLTDWLRSLSGCTSSDASGECDSAESSTSGDPSPASDVATLLSPLLDIMPAALRAALRTSGMAAALLTLLQMHCSHADAALAVCQALHGLVGDDKCLCCHGVVDVGTFWRAVVVLVQTHGSDPRLLKIACKLLPGTCCKAKYTERHTAALMGAPEALLVAMHASIDKADVVAAAAEEIEHIMTCGEPISRGESGLHEVLAADAAQIYATGMPRLEALLFAPEEGRAAKTVVAALLRHLEDARAVQAVCSMLALAGIVVDEEIAAIIAAGAPAALRAVLDHHAGDEGIVAAAMEVVAQICEIKAAGGDVPMLEAVEMQVLGASLRHPTSMRVATLVAATLVNFIRCAAEPDAMAAKIAQSDVLHHLMAALPPALSAPSGGSKRGAAASTTRRPQAASTAMRSSNCSQGCAYLCRLVSSIAKHHGVARLPPQTACDACKYVADVLRWHSTHIDAVNYACCAIRFMSADAECWRRLSAAGMHQLLVDCFSMCAESDSAYHVTCVLGTAHAMEHYGCKPGFRSAHCVTVAQLIAASQDHLRVLISIMERHRHDPGVAQAASSLMQDASNPAIDGKAGISLIKLGALEALLKVLQVHSVGEPKALPIACAMAFACILMSAGRLQGFDHTPSVVLADHDGDAQADTGRGDVTALVAALRCQNRTAASSNDISIAFAMELAVENERNAAALLRAGVAEELVVALRKDFSDADTAHELLVVLRSVCVATGPARNLGCAGKHLVRMCDYADSPHYGGAALAAASERKPKRLRVSSLPAGCGGAIAVAMLAHRDAVDGLGLQAGWTLLGDFLPTSDAAASSGTLFVEFFHGGGDKVVTHALSGFATDDRQATKLPAASATAFALAEMLLVLLLSPAASHSFLKAGCAASCIVSLRKCVADAAASSSKLKVNASRLLCGIIAALSLHDDEACSTVARMGVAGAVVAVISPGSKLDTMDVAAQAMMALRNIAACTEARPRMMAADAAPAVLGCVRRFELFQRCDSRLQCEIIAAGCAALRNLAASPEYRAPLMAMGACDVALQALHSPASRDAAVAGAACSLLAALAFEPANTQQLLGSDAAAAAISAMRRHTDDAKVVWAVSGVLQKLSEGCAAAARALIRDYEAAGAPGAGGAADWAGSYLPLLEEGAVVALATRQAAADARIACTALAAIRGLVAARTERSEGIPGLLVGAVNATLATYEGAGAPDLGAAKDSLSVCRRSRRDDYGVIAQCKRIRACITADKV